ncbi:hypothetical protein [Frankia sp. Cr2]|nr:hypothetical protein [Frankia sp. Cr2]
MISARMIVELKASAVSTSNVICAVARFATLAYRIFKRSASSNRCAVA